MPEQLDKLGRPLPKWLCVERDDHGQPVPSERENWQIKPKTYAGLIETVGSDLDENNDAVWILGIKIMESEYSGITLRKRLYFGKRGLPNTKKVLEDLCPNQMPKDAFSFKDQSVLYDMPVNITVRIRERNGKEYPAVAYIRKITDEKHWLSRGAI